ncbi:putative malonic semialdehyde reductase RutE [Legionella birminghamensis]|uniref:Putative NADH dehydrogenase/NAD(P)H nitroreductase Lbir_1885 n=1 Tax=Legionella birminghamensis TaxID=28083 RepID=A0A378I9V6_9GAMM|nr:malonic semialdehyde reductase [Legionella birminghamensis]KTC70110.1 putative malonic semialdehyde reductase RutE [Legionella birminghamensis]STX31997.1 Probable malonic semialdehyde reductase RutE [Legionella birminghamensis]
MLNPITHNATIEETLTRDSIGSLSSEALRQLFLDARTHHFWQDRPVSDLILRKLFDLVKWAPTCVNGSPARILFIKSPLEKAKLLPCLMEKNVEKTRLAPVTAIIAYDLAWFEYLDALSPHFDYKPMFESNTALSEATAFRSGSLQGAYLIMAARALGLDVGPMSGFNSEMVDEIFFKGTNWRTNFLCNLGYGDKSKLHPRAPRLKFEEACQII